MKNQFSYKTFYVVLSKHALKRLIMRCQQPLKNPHDLSLYLNKMTKKLVFASLALISDFNSKRSKVDGYTVIDGIFLPMVFESGINTKGKAAAMCTITTFMPEHYESAVKELSKRDPLKPSSDFFDYAKHFVILDSVSAVGPRS